MQEPDNFKNSVNLLLTIILAILCIALFISLSFTTYKLFKYQDSYNKGWHDCEGHYNGSFNDPFNYSFVDKVPEPNLQVIDG